MAFDINTVANRQKLKPSREPHYVRLSTGCYLGYRKMTADSEGSWVARCRDEGTGKQHKRSLGTFDALPPSRRYDAAKAEAEGWFKHLGMGGTTGIVTVRRACEDYIEYVRLRKGEKPAKDIEARFGRWVFSDQKLDQIELAKLTRAHVEQWRRGLAGTAVRVNRDEAKPRTRQRAPGSVNRDMTALRAALNHAHDGGHVTTDLAWRVALRPIPNADGRRDVYLDRDQRRELLKQADGDVATLLRGLSMVPLRPGALASLTAAHFDRRLGVLTIGKDKAGRDRKIKLPDTTTAFFADLAKDKLPAAPLLSRNGGRRWTKDDWKWPIKEAAKAAGLPDATTAYAMRHSVITDLVTGGLDLLTIAQLSGTSVAMIEKHYGHLRADHAAAALAALAL